MRQSIDARASRFVLGAVLALAGVAVQAQPADTVFVNGKIVAADAKGSIHQALAVRDEKIIAIGRSTDVSRHAGPKTRVIDLRGRTVIPGLIDSHIHAHPRGAQLQHRGALDRRRIARRGDRADSRGSAARRSPEPG